MTSSQLIKILQSEPCNNFLVFTTCLASHAITCVIDLYIYMYLPGNSALAGLSSGLDQTSG